MRAKRNAQGIADALFSSKPNPAKAQVNIVPNRNNNSNSGGNGIARVGVTQFAGAAARAGGRQQGPPTGGITIKGSAGPHVVEVRGFAPGTTAADVEQSLRDRGISVHSCRVLESSPKVIVDILCDTKEDADRIGEFHQQWVRFFFHRWRVVEHSGVELTTLPDRLRREDRQGIPTVRLRSQTSTDGQIFPVTVLAALAEQRRAR